MPTDKRYMFSPQRRFCVALSIVAVLCIGSCGGRSPGVPDAASNGQPLASTDAGTAGFPSLPSPGALARITSDDAVTSRLGADYDLAFPRQRVDITGTAATFDPL